MKRRILLVDDDLPVLLTLKAVLELNHFDVDTATSAGEAMKRLSENVYQLVITDARMETEDAGFHVVRAARKQPYNPATAMLTAFPQSSTHWKQEGAQSLLVKPVGTEDLLRQIEALLVRHEDEKHQPSQLKDAAGRDVSSSNREGRRKAS
jgi:DNA-binding response OmpR family regulator